MRSTNSRPSTFQCAWCGRTKALARTGRMPTFCSDPCRRAPKSAESGLRTATWNLEAAQRAVKHYSEALSAYERRLRARPPTKTREAYNGR